MSSGALVTAVVASLGAAGITLAVSESLRCFSAPDVNARMFNPRRTRRGEAVPSRRLFSWLGPLLRTADSSLDAENFSADALLVLRFKRFALDFLLFTAPFDLSLVMWANVSGTVQVTGDLERLSMAHVADGSATLWCHFASAIWKVLVGGLLLHRTGCWVEELKTLVPHGVESRTLIIQLPDSSSSSSSVVRDTIQSGIATSIDPPRGPLLHAIRPLFDPGPLEKLAAKRANLIDRLEDARYMLAHPKKEPAQRPMHRPKACGLCGPKMDSLDAWEAELEEVNARLASAREAASTPGASSEDVRPRKGAFVTFSSPADASIAQASVSARTWRMRPAPPPSDLLAQNSARLPLSKRRLASCLSTTALYVMCLFFMIPIAFVSALSTLGNLEAALPPLKPVLEISIAKDLLEGLLPGLALIIFLAFLPALVRALAMFGGVSTRSRLDVAELCGTFTFSCINVLLGNIIAGSVFTGIKAMVNDPTTIVSTLSIAVPNAGVLFVTFVFLKSAAGAASDVGVVVPSVIYLVKTRLLGARHTPRREAVSWQPGAVALGSEASNDLLVFLLVLTYSTIAPLIMVAGLANFTLHRLSFKEALLARHEPAYEGGAIMWRPLRNRIVVAFAFYLIVVTLVFSLKHANVQAALLLPLSVLLLISAVGMEAMLRSRAKPLLATPFSSKESETSAADDASAYLLPPLRPVEATSGPASV